MSNTQSLYLTRVQPLNAKLGVIKRFQGITTAINEFIARSTSAINRACAPGYGSHYVYWFYGSDHTVNAFVPVSGINRGLDEIKRRVYPLSVKTETSIMTGHLTPEIGVVGYLDIEIEQSEMRLLGSFYQQIFAR